MPTVPYSHQQMDGEAQEMQRWVDTSSPHPDRDAAVVSSSWCYVVSVNQKLATIRNTSDTTIGDVKGALADKFHRLPHDRFVPREAQDVWLCAQLLADDDLLDDYIWNGAVLIMKEKKLNITLHTLDGRVLTDRFKGSDLVAHMRAILEVELAIGLQGIGIGRLGIHGDITEKELSQNNTLRECGLYGDVELVELSETEGQRQTTRLCTGRDLQVRNYSAPAETLYSCSCYTTGSGAKGAGMHAQL